MESYIMLSFCIAYPNTLCSIMYHINTIITVGLEMPASDRHKSFHVAHTHSVLLNLGHFWAQLVFYFPGVMEKIPEQ